MRTVIIQRTMYKSLELEVEDQFFADDGFLNFEEFEDQVLSGYVEADWHFVDEDFEYIYDVVV